MATLLVVNTTQQFIRALCNPDRNVKETEREKDKAANYTFLLNIS